MASIAKRKLIRQQQQRGSRYLVSWVAPESFKAFWTAVGGSRDGRMRRKDHSKLPLWNGLGNSGMVATKVTSYVGLWGLNAGSCFAVILSHSRIPINQAVEGLCHQRVLSMTSQLRRDYPQQSLNRHQQWPDFLIWYSMSENGVCLVCLQIASLMGKMIKEPRGFRGFPSDFLTISFCILNFELWPLKFLAIGLSGFSTLVPGHHPTHGGTLEFSWDGKGKPPWCGMLECFSHFAVSPFAALLAPFIVAACL